MKAAFRIPAPVKPAVTLSESARAAREAACAQCDWNHEPKWTACEHPGCPVCPGKQRRAGGLKAMLAQPQSRCPMNLWRE